MLGTLQFEAHFLELPGKPFAGALAHVPADFQVLPDILIGQGVGEAGGHVWIGGIALDGNDAGFWCGLDFQAVDGPGEGVFLRT